VGAPARHFHDSCARRTAPRGVARGRAPRRWRDVAARARAGGIAWSLARRGHWGDARRSGLEKRVLTKLGLLSWSQGPGLQDDALDYGLAADLLSRAGTELRLELRGYQGYQSRDKPMLASVRALQPVASAAPLSFALSRGIRRDAPDWEVRAGVVLRLATPFGER
jgi:hypothetical protein